MSKRNNKKNKKTEYVGGQINDLPPIIENDGSDSDSSSSDEYDGVPMCKPQGQRERAQVLFCTKYGWDCPTNKSGKYCPYTVETKEKYMTLGQRMLKEKMLKENYMRMQPMFGTYKQMLKNVDGVYDEKASESKTLDEIHSDNIRNQYYGTGQTE